MKNCNKLTLYESHQYICICFFSSSFFLTGSAPAGEDFAVYSRNHHNNRDDDRDLWFKAAVIAVPIAGGFILVLLVLLAVHMLKTDSRHHRRLIHLRRQRSLTKAHMYISEHFSGKGTKQHFSLFNEKTRSTPSKLYSDKSAANSTSHTCSDGSSKYCSYSHHNTVTSKLDSSSTRCSSTSSQRHSSFSSTPPITCSINGDSHHKDKNDCVLKPCAFHGNLSKNTCLTRDISVKSDKGCHSFHRGTRLDSNGAHHGPNHQLLSVATWENACQKGPTALV